MGDETADDVAWSYEQVADRIAALGGLIAFYRNRVQIEDGEGS